MGLLPFFGDFFFPPILGMAATGTAPWTTGEEMWLQPWRSLPSVCFTCETEQAIEHVPKGDVGKKPV